MQKRSRVAGLLALTVVLTSAVHAGPRRRATRHPSAMDAAVESYLAKGIPGIVVAVRRGTADPYEKAYGDAGLDTIFQIGSITKQFTAAAVLRLAEQGKLSLGDDVRKFMPELNTHGYRVTIEHLLRHTSGIPDLNESEVTAPLNLAAAIALLNAKPFHFAPGWGWEYSNIGYYCLGIVVERAGGMQYPDFLEQTFFLPLGLTHTAYCGRPPAWPVPSGSHEGLDGTTAPVAPLDMSLLFSAGAVCSTSRSTPFREREKRTSSDPHDGHVLVRRLTSIAPWRCRDCGRRFWAHVQRRRMFAR